MLSIVANLREGINVAWEDATTLFGEWEKAPTITGGVITGGAQSSRRPRDWSQGYDYRAWVEWCDECKASEGERRDGLCLNCRLKFAAGRWLPMVFRAWVNNADEAEAYRTEVHWFSKENFKDLGPVRLEVTRSLFGLLTAGLFAAFQSGTYRCTHCGELYSLRVQETGKRKGRRERAPRRDQNHYCYTCRENGHRPVRSELRRKRNARKAKDDGEMNAS